jgi:hypothetical protein
MEWDSVISSLIGSSPSTALCALAVRALWKRLQERDAEITATQEKRVSDLLTIVKSADSSKPPANK